MPLRNQIYLGLQDNGLIHDRDTLDKALAEIVEDFSPDRIYTTGPDGYDGNIDHIEVHDSVLRVSGRLGLLRLCAGLNSLHSGELRVAYNARKLGAMALHRSQQVSDDLLHWGDTEIYTPLIMGPETYSFAAAI